MLEVQRPFDRPHGPLLRVTLYTLGAEKYWPLIVIQHIVFDGSSIPVLSRALDVLYQACITGQPSPWPEFATAYADFRLGQGSGSGCRAK